MPDATPDKSRPLRLILALAGVVLVLIAGLAWLNRKTLAREALTGWLRSKGVAANAEVEAFGPTAFTARLTLGDPRNPDFAAERAEVRYRPTLGGIELVSVTLKKPVLRARYAGGKLSVGSLDPLVRDFLRRPPPPGAKVPRIQIDGGVLTLATEYGPLRLAGDVLVDDGQLRRLAAASDPARLKGRDFDVTLGAASLRQSAASDRFHLSLVAPIPTATFGGRALTEARLTLEAQGPYPDLVKRRGEGPVVIRAALTGRKLTGAGQDFEGVTVDAAFDGATAGWGQTLRVAGRASADLSASAVRASGARSGAIRARLASDDLRWTRAGADVVQANARLTGSAAGVAVSHLRLDRAGLDGRFKIYASRASVQLDGAAALEGHGRWTGLGAPAKGDAAQVAALKRAAGGFRITAPETHLKFAAFSEGRRPQDTRVLAWLERPLRVLPDTGGFVQVAMGPDTPVRITSGGGGLPEADARLSNIGANGFDVTLKARRLAFGPMTGGEVEASGRVGLGAAVTFTTPRCAPFRAARLAFGANAVETLYGRLCPTRGPLLRLADDGWSLNARAETVSAAIPFAQARVGGGAAIVTARGRGGDLSLQARVASARISDTAPQTRFNPLAVSGPVGLAGSVLRADLAVRTPGGAPVARALVTHDLGRGAGGVDIDTGALRFAEGGLQPVQLAPAASAIGSPVTGSARFAGRFDWAASGVTSSGTLSVPGLDFTSPAGPVKGLQGEIVFESLAPLRATPGQTLSVAEIQAIVPLTGLRAQFSLADNLLTIAGGEAAVGGGKVRVETLQIPLAPGLPIQGVLIFEGVQLHDLVEASPFGDKVEFDARVSGRVPFEMTDNRVRITGGELKAIQPGRISIDRTALTGVQADTAVAAPAPVADPNATFTDFAYQAMENLAFDTLEASLASREDGRLGVVFHIIGRHDPPTRQQIRLSLMDLIQKRFLGRKLPLPSGTKVNLTLDTTLNLDDLLSDWSEYQKARSGGSPAVQP